MSSLSLSRIPRPYQFALLAVLLVGALWFAVLHKMVNSSSETAPPPAHAPTSVHRAAGAAGATAAHHAGSATAPLAPGTHPAPAATSTHRVTAAPAPKPAPATTHAAAAAAAAATAHHAAVTTHHAAVTTKHVTAIVPKKSAPAATGAHPVVPGPAPVQAIEQELAAHKLAIVLFWSPGSTTSAFVKSELGVAAHGFGGNVAVHYALPSQVSEYGTFTRKQLITETPTIMLIASAEHVTTLPGYNDAASISQAIEEAGAKQQSAPPRPSRAAKPHK
jgi:hypothetical protein